MHKIQTNGDHGAAHETSDRVTASNGDTSAVCTDPEATETDVLLSVQTDGCNGETTPSNRAAPPKRNGQSSSGEGCNGDAVTSADVEAQETSANASPVVRGIKTELNEIIFWKVRVWMAIICIFVLIAVVIIISLAVCSAIHPDVDEKYDPSLFTFPLYFNGSFQLPNMVFKEELFTLSLKESQTLAADLQGKLADLYRSSPALGRYFSGAEIKAFRNGSVIADYQLKFLMPEEHQDLKSFTLSREMVYNVFRQFLYDQESDESEPMYIDPRSLIMFIRQ